MSIRLMSMDCARCGTELAAAALACPACGSLVHADTLKRLAAEAETSSASGDLETARARWQAALELLPPSSQQYTAIRQRTLDLTNRLSTQQVRPDPTGHSSGWRRGLAAAASAGLLLLGKLKFLLLGLTKITTFVSMFAFFGVYWSVYGWPLALGLVVSIYIHEMGHVSMLRRLGIEAGAPLFIPGVGALVMLRQHVDDPLTDAKIGLAGPVWGLGAALGAMAIYLVTHASIWLAIAHLTGFINLFNLIPIWQLDGGRGFHVLSRSERWAVVTVMVAAYLMTNVGLLIILAAVAVWRAMQKESGPGDVRTAGTFAGLVAVLSALAIGLR
jgi:Zn-dependent protease